MRGRYQISDIAQHCRCRKGKLEEAEALYREALQIKEATLGRQHPSTATTRQILADLRKAKGK